MSENHTKNMKVEKFLQAPTEQEKQTAVYENGDIEIFPHVLTEYVFSCPQSAVFRIKTKKGTVACYMSISWNRHVCAVPITWQEVFDEFLVFARANKYKSQSLGMADFFKNAPGQYAREPMAARHDLSKFKEEA